jgi:hypothetical protein
MQTLLVGLALIVGAAPPVPSSVVDRFLLRYDRNRDGVIDRKEWPGPPAAFDRLDVDKDGKLSRKELAAIADRLGRLLREQPGNGEVNTPAAKGERLPDRLKVGDAAPDFTLSDLSGKKKVTLSAYWDKRPVVLIFASYT